MTFEQHGHYELELNGNILFVVAKGEWNAEASINIMRDIKHITQGLHGKPWAMHIDVLSWVLGTPEFQQVVTAELLGLTHSAYVFDEGLAKLAQISSSQPKSDNHHWQMFNNHADALDWLKQQGFKLERK
ncbi:hypothetical protein [Neptunicella sp. SCSIO 80796]|uniref:hypothetical protein n=1 Tax=Neptunicella plasticusilytica TaxID=3117012 RepID=UPI003A4DCDD1